MPEIYVNQNLFSITNNFSIVNRLFLLEMCDFVDNYLTAVFYKGVLYKHMNKLSEAQQCFTIVLNESVLKEFRLKFF